MDKEWTERLATRTEESVSTAELLDVTGAVTPKEGNGDLENNAYETNESDKVEAMEENGKNKKCDPCLFDEIQTNAIAFCIICIDYLCKGCVRDHRRSRMTRNHKVLEGDEMPKDPSAFKMLRSMMSCSDHPEMEVSFECKDHGTYICSSCLAVNHRKCDEVIEVLKTSKAEDEEHGVVDLLKTVHEKILTVRKDKEENIKTLHLDQDCISRQRAEFIEKVQENLLILDGNSKSETENVLANAQVVLEKDVNECKEMENVATKHLELLDVTVKYGTAAELNIISKLTLKQAKLWKEDKKTQEKHTKVNLKFHENRKFTCLSSIGSTLLLKEENMDEMLDKRQGNELILESSSDAVGDTPLHTNDIVDEKTRTSRNVKENKSLMQSTVNRTRVMHDISRGAKGTKSCSLTSILILSDGRIVVTDHSNESIKLLKSDFSLDKEFPLDGKPTDMCQFSRNRFAVLLDGRKVVNRFSVTEDMKYYISGFATKLYPISICQSNDNRVVILFTYKEKGTPNSHEEDTYELQVRTMHDGKIIRQFTDFKNKLSATFNLEDPGRIRVMPKNENAFLISLNNKIYCFDTDKAYGHTLKEHWFYKSDNDNVIDDITDITADKEGNIYVCGNCSKNIHQISDRNFMYNRVILSVPGTPLSVCVDDKRRCLIVGCENDDFIYVATFE